MTPSEQRLLIVCAADFAAPSEQQAFAIAQWVVANGGRAMISIRGETASLNAQGFADAEHIEILPRGRLRGRAPDEYSRVCAFRPTAIYAFCPRPPVVAAARRYKAVTGAPVFVHFEDNEWGLAVLPRTHSASRRAAWTLLRAASSFLPEVYPRPTDASLTWVVAHAQALDALTPALAREVTSRHERDCQMLLPVTARVASMGTTQEQRSSDSDTTVLGFTGAVFGPHLPDYEILLKAIAELQHRGQRIKLVHAGRLARRFDPARLAADAGVAPGTVDYRGQLPVRDARAILNDVDVLVQPGAPSEFNRLRLPSKLQTYLASGTPVITFAVGFGELLEHRVDAFLTRSGSPRELADAITTVVSDRDLNSCLAVGGPEAARRLFDTERNATQLMRHLEENGETGER